MSFLKQYVCAVFLLLALLSTGCSGANVQSSTALHQEEEPDRTIQVTILQLNDVYEITPVQGGQWGGLARVASLREELLAQNPNTITVIAGDFFSPSALGTSRVDGERLAGKQMVAVLNALGLDYATFGNHEFDVNREQFYQRLAESEFTYLSSNVFDENGKPFPGVEQESIVSVAGEPGDTLRLGLVGVTLGSNPKDYVSYTEPLQAIKEATNVLKGRTNAVLALTHLAVDEDTKVAATVPDLALIMGGHEHENIQVLRGPNLTPITKADANARTVYIHYLTYDPATNDLSIESMIQRITAEIPEEPDVAQVVDKWVGIAFEGFRQQGLKPGEPVVRLTQPLDGLESSVRNHPTALTDLITSAMMHVADDAEVAVFNGGSIRIDDVLQPGTLIQYDVIRILPFGGDVLSVDMKGSLLDSTLTQGFLNKGTGGFLHYAGIERQGEAWLVNGERIDPARTYRVAINDFLVSGNEANLGYLNFDNPSLTRVDIHGDVRLAVIAELERQY